MHPGEGASLRASLNGWIDRRTIDRVEKVQQARRRSPFPRHLISRNFAPACEHRPERTRSICCLDVGFITLGREGFHDDETSRFAKCRNSTGRKSAREIAETCALVSKDVLNLPGVSYTREGDESTRLKTAPRGGRFCTFYTCRERARGG